MGGSLTRMSDHPRGQFHHPGQQPAWQNPTAPQGWRPMPYQQQGWPAPPPKKKGMSTRIKVLLAAGVLVVAGGTAWAAWILRVPQGQEKQAVSLEVGDCVRMTGAGEAVDAVKTPCDTPATPYVVSIKGIDKGTWDCQKGFYRLAVHTKRAPGVAICLGLNGQVGACFDDLESKTPPPLADCSKARLKVIQVLPTSRTVGDDCGQKAEKVVSYTSYGGASRFKDSTICLAAP
jgi:hypothetical protein